MVPKPLLVILLFVLAPPLHAQADTSGAMLDGHVVIPSGAPLAGAEVVWQGDKRSVLTAADGGFRLRVPVRALTVILVRRPGFTPQVLQVDLRSGDWHGSIVLTPGPERLPDIEVEARYAKPAKYSGTLKFDGFFRRQKLGVGSFISREQIEKSNATHTLEILRGIPGVYVNIVNPGDPLSIDIRIPRCLANDSQRLGKVSVWIDGARLIDPFIDSGDAKLRYGPNAAALAEMLERISPTGIEMVEVYRGASQIPGEFHWDGCAAIVIWTRWNPKPDSVARPPARP